jgi:hypothetical protein
MTQQATPYGPPSTVPQAARTAALRCAAWAMQQAPAHQARAAPQMSTYSYVAHALAAKVPARPAHARRPPRRRSGGIRTARGEME